MKTVKNSGFDDFPEQNKKRHEPARTGMLRNRYLFAADLLIIAVSYFFSMSLIYDVYSVIAQLPTYAGAILVTAAAFSVALMVTGTYTTLWVHGGTRDYLRIGTGCLVADVLSLAVSAIVFPQVHVKVNVCAIFMTTIGIIGLRMMIRGMRNIYRSQTALRKGEKKRLMIVGAGTTATILLKDLMSNEGLNYNVVCFVDDDKTKKNAIIGGARVLGDRYDIKRLAEDKDIDEILLAIPSAESADRREIIEICNETRCKVKILPSVDQMIEDTDLHRNIRDVEIEDLLAREPIELDNDNIHEYIRDKVILVTGGGGSIGSELCRQVMKYKPKKLIVLDIYENNAYDLQMELNYKYPNNKPEVVIASVRDIQRLEDVFEKYHPYIVFHAAAHKHVPLMEDSPGEAIKNNVFGTYNVIKCADKYKAKRFVMISTDKAVNPTNVMGATKRICEMMVQCMSKESSTEFVCVRFGNVLGSNGSVIPLFKRQIAAGGPVTVTDKRITRFFMTIPEASQLVLQAAGYAKGGEIFVLDMGEPVKIYDLARNLIKLSGYTPDVDIKITECGLRPGEKLYEELLMDEEGLANTSHKKIFIGRPIDIDRHRLNKMLSKLDEVCRSDDPEHIKDAIAEAVPTYRRLN